MSQGGLGVPTAATETLSFIHVDTGYPCDSLYPGLGQRMAEQGIPFPTVNHQPPSNPQPHSVIGAIRESVRPEPVEGHPPP